MNEAQKQLILESMSLTTPELYGAPRSPDEKARVDELMSQLQNRMLTVFGREELARIFGTLGAPEAQDDLFRKYRTISGVSMSSRRAAFGGATPEDKSDLWRTHLALYLARHPELNSAQGQTILDAMSLASPEFFLIPPDKVQDHVTMFENRVQELFSRIEAGKIFATLGESDPSQTVKASRPLLQAPAKLRQLNRLIRYDASEDDCECTTSCINTCWNYCAGGVCHHTDTGCGFLWQCPCTAKCAPILEE
jgi:hypothetical protein